MKYRMVNEELRIVSCSVSDLTVQQVASFLNQWESDAKIGDLTLFYEKETDYIVLNRDNEDYDTYLDIAEICLTLDDEELEGFLIHVPDGAKETVELLQHCRQRRKALQTLSLLKFQDAQAIPGREVAAVFDELMTRYSKHEELIFLLSDILNYGFMQGKRAERARRKK